MTKEDTKKTVDAPETATAQSTAEQQPQPDPNALSIGDLKGLMSILDVASTRGAFKAAEMAGVGFIYNKLSSFLAKVQPEGQQVGQGGAAQAPAPTEGK
jgi:hypothetical protein